jgi:hypothetical protein
VAGILNVVFVMSHNISRYVYTINIAKPLITTSELGIDESIDFKIKIKTAIPKRKINEYADLLKDARVLEKVLPIDFSRPFN